MSIYYPDRWIIIEIKTGTNAAEQETLHKVFASWSGSYLSGASWKLNSGNKSVTKHALVQDTYYVEGFSGSEYQLRKNSYGVHFHSQGVLDLFMKEAPELRVLSEEESLEYLEKMSNEHIPN